MKILVTGGNGMIGKNLQNIVSNEHEYFFPSSSEMNLLDFNSVDNYFDKIKPDFVIHFAANVGGLFKNMRQKVEMFHENIIINENILFYSNKYNVRNGIFCCSTCIFPDNPKYYPMDEKIMMDGEPHFSNNSYAYAKRFLYFQCKNYNTQYDRKYICITPCNLYGYYDNFNIENAHVIPALIHRFYNASLNNEKLNIRTGFNSTRQFIFIEDVCKIILLLIENFEKIEFDNVILSNTEHKIIDAIELIAQKFPNVVYQIDNIEEGQTKKNCSNELLKKTFPNLVLKDFNEGLNNTIDWFLENYEFVRK